VLLHTQEELAISSTEWLDLHSHCMEFDSTASLLDEGRTLLSDSADARQRSRVVKFETQRVSACHAAAPFLLESPSF